MDLQKIFLSTSKKETYSLTGEGLFLIDCTFAFDDCLSSMNAFKTQSRIELIIIMAISDVVEANAWKQVSAVQLLQVSKPISSLMCQTVCCH